METETPRWFVLNHIPAGCGRRPDAARHSVEGFNRSCGCSLELFAPTIVSVRLRGGRPVREEKPLTYHYVFVRGSLPAVRALCTGDNGFSLLLDAGGPGRYATVDDRRMEDFRAIARYLRNRLPVFPLDGADLESGDKVEVVDGPFPGLVGYYLPHSKSGSGNVLLQVTRGLGTVAYDVPARYVRVLEFSRKSRRGYDQLDAFVPRLYAALRSYASGTELSEREAASLTVFSRRMDVARLGDSKVEARLSAMLRAARFLLGDTEGERRARERYVRSAASVSSPATASYIKLLEAVTGRDRAAYSEGLALLELTGGRDTASVRLLREEYRHHGTWLAGDENVCTPL